MMSDPAAHNPAWVSPRQRLHAYIDGMERRSALSAALALLFVSIMGVGTNARADTADIVLFAFDSPAVVDSWITVNDPVMGGRSDSTVAFGDGTLVFSGTISLDNNGGFASTRSPVDAEIGRRATGATALGVRARGDGKTYLLKAETAGQPWSYVERFTTAAGVLQTYRLPVSGFEAVGRFLNPAPEAPQTLDPSTITRVSLYILDKQQGPFQIMVSAIVASL